MNIVFLMDSLESINIQKDTTFMLMLGAYQKGHHVYFLPSGGISRINGRLSLHVTQVIPQQNLKDPFVCVKNFVLSDSEVDVFFIRTDPPFNEEYLTNTWFLDFLPEDVLVINRPSGIRQVNEKIWVTQFTSLTPPTFIGRNKKDMLAFISAEKKVVAKPIDGYGGASIFIIEMAGNNTNVILETLSDNFTKDIVLQKYVADSLHGDKRILLLDGEPLGAVLRVHGRDDHRNNFFSGGKPIKTDIVARDKEIINILKPHLKKLGLYFVGIDIIGNYLIEVNVTSPTCLQEMNKIYGLNLEEKIIDFVVMSKAM